MKKTLSSLLFASTFAVLASLSGAAFAGAADDAIADAKEAQKQANSVGGEWRDTGKMIAKAEELLAAGKADEAEKLAREAEAQGMLGYMQATGQSKMGDLHI